MTHSLTLSHSLLQNNFDILRRGLANNNPPAPSSPPNPVVIASGASVPSFMANNAAAVAAGSRTSMSASPAPAPSCVRQTDRQEAQIDRHTKQMHCMIISLLAYTDILSLRWFWFQESSSIVSRHLSRPQILLSATATTTTTSTSASTICQ